MSPTPKSGRVGLGFSLGTAVRSGQRARPDEVPLDILVVADCSGRASRAVCEPLASRRARQLDIDRLDAVFADWGARIPTPLRQGSGEPLALTPRSIEDLHPDRLLENVVSLSEILELRNTLDTDAGAAERLTELLGGAPGAVHATTSSATTSSAAKSGGESSGDTLSRLLGASPNASQGKPALAAARGGIDVGRFIRDIVADTPGTTSAAPPRLAAALVAAANIELCNRLRALLREPALRELEATWRGIDGLCRNCPDDERVHHAVLDASLEELSADLDGLAALLLARPVSVVLVDHYFEPSSEDLSTLGRLLETCARHDTTLIAGAHPRLAGCEHFAETPNPEDGEFVMSEAASLAWAEIARARSNGARLALALPRFLLRQPYGKSGEPLEQLDFEELIDQSDHEAFSWGNGAYLVARALAVVHVGSGGSEHPDGSVDLRELPVVHLEGEDGIVIKPCAESWLSERAIGRLEGAGFSVLQGLRDTDRIRVHP